MDNEKIVYCSQCGEKMKNSSRYCMKCGKLNFNHEANAHIKEVMKSASTNQQQVEEKMIDNKKSDDKVTKYLAIAALLLMLFPYFTYIIALISSTHVEPEIGGFWLILMFFSIFFFQLSGYTALMSIVISIVGLIISHKPVFITLLVANIVLIVLAFTLPGIKTLAYYGYLQFFKALFQDIIRKLGLSWVYL